MLIPTSKRRWRQRFSNRPNAKACPKAGDRFYKQVDQEIGGKQEERDKDRHHDNENRRLNRFLTRRPGHLVPFRAHLAQERDGPDPFLLNLIGHSDTLLKSGELAVLSRDVHA